MVYVYNASSFGYIFYNKPCYNYCREIPVDPWNLNLNFEITFLQQLIYFKITKSGEFIVFLYYMFIKKIGPLMIALWSGTTLLSISHTPRCSIILVFNSLLYECACYALEIHTRKILYSPVIVLGAALGIFFSIASHLSFLRGSLNSKLELNN